MRVLEKYEEIMNIILPTLREERRKTYCPFTYLSENWQSTRDTSINNGLKNRKSYF